MIDGVPWQALTAAGGGWALFGLTMFGLVTGRWLISRREAQTYIDRAEKAEANNAKLLQQNAELLAFAQLGRATFSALRERAEEPA